MSELKRTYGLNTSLHPPGTAPGTLVNYRDQNLSTTISMIRYSETYFEEKNLQNITDAWAGADKGGICWINIQGYHSPEMLEQLGQHFGLHPLSLEDVIVSGQNTKLELYENYYFMVMQLLAPSDEINVQQISIFVGRNFVITLSEDEKGAFEPLRNRLRADKGLIRKFGTDYLAYCLCDTIIDLFFPAVERVRIQLDALEEGVFSGQEAGVPQKLHNLKVKLLLLGKLVWSAQEVIGLLQNQSEELVSRQTAIYLRDCYSHTVQLIHIIDSCREISSGMMESYLSLVSNQMNQVMKILTLIATIFIPLTFIVGVYGMNFNPEAGPLSMPELNWPLGYAGVWTFMLLLAAGMLLFFKRKKWL
ncbi:MAG: magnesium/cobalt transporter CorA [Syntrophomonas sp.]